MATAYNLYFFFISIVFKSGTEIYDSVKPFLDLELLSF